MCLLTEEDRCFVTRNRNQRERQGGEQDRESRGWFCKQTCGSKLINKIM